MQSVLSDLQGSRATVSLSFLNLSIKSISFSAMISGIFMGRGVGFEDALTLAESLQHMFSVKKIITEAEYVLLLSIIYYNPNDWRLVQEKILVPRAAKQEINIEEVRVKLGLVLGEDQPSVVPDSTIVENGDPKLMGDIKALVESQEEMNKRLKQEQIDSMELIKKLQEADKSQEVEKSDVEGEDCGICMVNLYQQQAEPFPLENCGHVFHSDCLRSCLDALISERKFPLICPSEECKKQVAEQDFKLILPISSIQKYQEFTFKNYMDTNSDSVSWCPTAGCKFVFFYSSEDDNRFECPECHKQYCWACKAEWHRNMTCKEYQISSNFTADDEKFMKFVTGAHYKQCPKCKFFVEKTMGCDHMRCRCTYEFCYKCGGKYMDCECTREQQRQMEQRRLINEQKREKKRLRMEALALKKRIIDERRDNDDEEQVPKRRTSRRKNGRGRE